MKRRNRLYFDMKKDLQYQYYQWLERRSFYCGSCMAMFEEECFCNDHRYLQEDDEFEEENYPL